MNDTNDSVKTILCTVCSDKMNKSRVAFYERLVQDDRFKKYIKRKTKIMFHDENNESKLNDKVLVKFSRPRSANKHFELVKIVEANKNISVDL